MSTFKPDQVRTRHCCFCIPAKAAVMILSLIAATFAAMHGINAVIRLFSGDSVDGWSIWLCMAQIVLWFSLVVIALYGWAGCIMQRREWVDWFYELVWWHLWLNVIFGLQALVLLNLPSAKQVATAICLRTTLQAQGWAENLGDPEPALGALAFASEACFSQIKYALLMLDFAWVIAILVELYLVLVIGHYLDQLADYEAAVDFGVDIESANPPFRFSEVEQNPLIQAQLRKSSKRY
ncbi:hypothetical protein JCM11641_005789 [Rhodosporidiobolus odoratus]